MHKLIVQPLEKSATSTVIVIDALDECKDDEPASAILSVLGQFVSQIPKAKFFVTGRPEPQIREGFRLPLLAPMTDVFVLHEVVLRRVNNDIRLFFRHTFMELSVHRRGLDGWPTQEQLNLLCERASGLFVYAVATVRFIGQKNNSPKKQLDRLLESPENSGFEGKTMFKPNATLNSLYMSILQDAFGEDDPDIVSKVRSVLGAVILAVNPLSPSTIATLLGFDIEEVSPLLTSMHSLLTLQEDDDRPVQPFHKSFPDFIIDPTRCTTLRFLVHPPDHHAGLLVGCLELMNRSLEQNMCKLPDGAINSEVSDLKERTKQNIDHALQYACKSWHKHLDGTVPTDKITSVLHLFLERKFLFWLEVLSVLGAARDAVDALDAVAKWFNVRSVMTFHLFSGPGVHPDQIQAQASPTSDLVNDFSRFVIGFFEVISTSAPHIYHSALPQSPRTSTIQELYEPYARPLARVVQGTPISWEPGFSTVSHRGGIFVAAWSPCSRYIATSLYDPPTIEILDAVTLGIIHIFKPQSTRGWLSFSPDSRLLTHFSDGHQEVTTWDLQTGGRIGTIPPTSHITSRCFSSTYSTDGKIVAVAHRDKFNVAANTTTDGISTYDLLSGTHIYSHHVSEGRVVASIWTHDECLRFITVKPGTITVWQVGFGSVHTLANVESFPTPDNIDYSDYSEDALFLPTRSLIAFPRRGIWDVRDSRFLLKIQNRGSFAKMSFSSDGRFFLYEDLNEIHLWEEAAAGYIFRGELFTGVGRYWRTLLSPDGKSIIDSTGEKTQLWRTIDPITSLSDVPTRPIDGLDFLLDFSPGGSLAAAAREGGKVVTVLDLKSGEPRLIIDTGKKICGLWVTGNTITVFDGKRIIAWELSTGDHVLDARATISDSVRTITLGHPAPPSDYLHIAAISRNLNYIVTLSWVGDTAGKNHCLGIYDLSTGNHLAGTIAQDPCMLWVTPDGREVWLSTRATKRGRLVKGWEVIGDGKSNVVGLEPLPENTIPREDPCRSSHGYDVVDDGWILNSRKKRLLWLPHHWRKLNETDQRWDGRFLGLVNQGLPKPFIVELGE